MQAAYSYFKLVQFYEANPDHELSQGLSNLTSITIGDVQIDFKISLGFNTRACRVFENDKEVGVFEIIEDEIYSAQGNRTDAMDTILIIKEEPSEQKYEDDSDSENDEEYCEYSREYLQDEGRVGHWSDDDEDDE